MLTQIYVKNFILIDNINLTFDRYMSAFTGETGAGKSLLIDAIGILRGDRISGSMVKQNQEKATIEGVFELTQQHPSVQKLADAGYDLEDNTLIITREFTKDGKSVSRINQRQTTVSFIKEIIGSLIDIHSQHDTQYLLNNKYHLSLLDAFCKHEVMLDEVKHLYKLYKEYDDALTHALQNEYNEDDLDFLTFQLNEIDEANITEGELEEIEAEQKRMMSFEKLTTHLNQACELLDGTQGSNPALYNAYKELDAISDVEDTITMRDALLEAYYAIDDQLQQIRDYADSLEYDDQRFNEIQERIFLIHKLQRKYGNRVSDIIEKRNELEQKIDLILHRQDYIAKQERLKKEAYENFHVKAEQLQQQRKQKALILEENIVSQLKELHLPHAKFHVHFLETEGQPTGIDKVEFMISMNTGEGLKPLSTTASGGELSRLMLGLKTIFTQLQGIETIIFDEIDTGVSGSVAFAIGKKMQELGQTTQVFCVTHLAQVAACANNHYLVKKVQEENSTSTSIIALDELSRIEQLAMIASDSTSASALEAAKELYTKAQN